MLRILIFIRVRKEARAFLAAMRTFKHDGKENEALSFPLFFMVGVIEMCGLLMIALHAKATFARPAARERSKRVLAVQENRSKYSNLQTKDKTLGQRFAGRKCRNEPFDGQYVCHLDPRFLSISALHIAVTVAKVATQCECHSRSRSRGVCYCTRILFTFHNRIGKQRSPAHRRLSS